MFSATQFQGINALVVGDVMLDRYWFGSVDRISPEAPVPVLAVTRRERRAGGAANVAHNIQALGATSTLLSVVGDDAAGKELMQIVSDFGAKPIFRIDASLDTTEKLRMIAQNQQLLRADFERPPAAEVLQQCLQDYEKQLPQTDVVILSDYGKGGLVHVAEMIKQAKAMNVPVIVDPKGSDFSKYAGATMITPNRKEFVEVVGEFQNNDELEEKAFALRKKLSLEYLLVTRSEQGMSLFTENEHIHSAARAQEVFDVSGAGDTVIASIAMTVSANMTNDDRLAVANAAASIVVAKVGTAVATSEEIAEHLQRS